MQDYYTPKGKHLTLTERRMIKLLEGQSNREIARRLAKAPQTIHNEVKRGQVRQQVRQGKYEQVYSADFAQKAYQNNIALKRLVRQRNKALSFGTIQNNIALKRQNARRLEEHGFGTIQNNIALKPGNPLLTMAVKFWDHSKQHSSKTYSRIQTQTPLFWDHSKQHSSKTQG